MITILVDQHVLNKKKKILYEIKNTIAGVGESLSRRLCSMCGFLPNTYISKIRAKSAKRFMRVYHSFEGLSDYNHYLFRRFYNQRRSNAGDYKSMRFNKGYPLNQRTRSNANTARKKLDIKISVDYFYGQKNQRQIAQTSQKWTKNSKIIKLQKNTLQKKRKK